MKHARNWDFCIVAFLMLAIVALSAIFLGGCSGLQAFGTTATGIDQAASVARGNVAAVDQDTALCANAQTFQDEYTTATISTLKYAFGGQKILANAAIYVDLEKKAAIACAITQGGIDRPFTADEKLLALQIEAQWENNTDAQLHGQAAVGQLYTVSKLKTSVRKLQKLKATTAPSVDLQSLISAVPTQFQPWVSQYGPALLNLTAQQINEALELLIQGDTDTPYRAALKGMTCAEVLNEAASTLTATDIPATNQNAANVAMEREAMYAALSLGFTLLLGVL